MALAHWFNITFNDNTSTKKLFFKLKFLYVDNTFLKEKYLKFDETKKDILLEERATKKAYLDALFKRYNFECEIINLENILDLQNINLINSENLEIENPNNNNNNDNNLNNLNNLNEKKQILKSTNFDLISKYLKIYENISKAGSFETDFTKILTRNLIFYYSKLHGFNKLIFGNNGQSLEEKTLIQIRLQKSL